MKVSIQSLLKQAASLLQNTEHPLFEAELLLAFVLQKPRSYLHAWPDQEVPTELCERFYLLTNRRQQGEPIAYLTGTQEFWSLPLAVTPATLIPRPDTEILVEQVLAHFSKERLVKLADLGTGSGAIALALASERPLWTIDATDISESALQIASLNAQTLGLNQIRFHAGRWCDALPSRDYDAIVSNPPYIAEVEWGDFAAGLLFEPKSALLSGADGLDDIREICTQASSYLKPGGYLFIEHGFKQGDAVRKIFATSGYTLVHSVRDLSSNERVTIGTYSP